MKVLRSWDLVHVDTAGMFVAVKIHVVFGTTKMLWVKRKLKLSPLF